MLAIRTILHPTDFSVYSQHAFKLACSLARDYKARLVVLHVAEPPLAVYEGAMLTVPINPELLLAQLKEVQPDDSSLRVEHRLLEGDAVEGILKAAKETDCDLIVMGTHGRTALGRLLMGSVADRVVRKAACPVLTLKSPFQPHEQTGEEAELVAAGERAKT